MKGAVIERDVRAQEAETWNGRHFVLEVAESTREGGVHKGTGSRVDRKDPKRESTKFRQ